MLNSIKEKIRLSLLGKEKTDAHKKNISKSKQLEKHPNWKRSHSEKTKEKIKVGNLISKSRNYILRYGDKKYYLTSSSLKEFCIAHKISWHSLMKSKNLKTNYKGWSLLDQ